MNEVTATTTAAVLEARSVGAGYGPQPVIHDIDIVVQPGEVVGLLGANGAWKTRDNLRVADVDIDVALDLFPELERLLAVRAGLLSGGEQQMLTLARALSRKPRVLLADELSMGLAPLIVKRLLEAVVRIAKNQGTAVLLVEQHVRKALEYCDRAYVMHRGRIELSGSAGELMGRLDEIEDRYLTSAVSGDDN